jgi:hypothetical protein
MDYKKTRFIEQIAKVILEHEGGRAKKDTFSVGLFYKDLNKMKDIPSAHFMNTLYFRVARGCIKLNIKT